MKKIGEILKTERENRGLSLHEIGMSLKINPKILKAIEDGDEKNLPAKTFLRGFIRSYAQYLRLNVDEILEMFQNEVGSTRPPEPRSQTEAPASTPQAPAPSATPISPVAQEPKPVKVTPEKPLRKPTDESLNPSSSNRMLTIVGAIVLVLLIAFVAKMVEKYQKEAAHPDEPTVTTTTLAPSAENLATPAVNESVPPEASAAGVNGMASVTTMPAHSEVMTAVPAKSTTTTTTSTSTTVKVTTTTLRPTTTTVRPTTTTVKAVVAAPIATTTTSTTLKVTTTTVKGTTTTTTTLPGKKVVEVIVEALNKVSIKYTLGDSASETLEMTADQVHTFKGKGKITLEVSDGGAISVIVNGRDKGVPGTIGQPTKLTYP